MRFTTGNDAELLVDGDLTPESGRDISGVLLREESSRTNEKESIQ